MVLITDIVLQFINTELVPKIVAKTAELSVKGLSNDDIVKEICSTDFSDSSKIPLKRSALSKTATTSSKPATAVTIDEYMDEHKDSQVCIYVYSRGENKGKICCRPVTSSSYNKDDKKTQRCTLHENSSPGPDIESLLAKTKTPSKTDQVAKMRKTFPKGSPEVLNTSTENIASSGLGKISIKDQLLKDAIKIETPKKEVSITPQRERTPVKTPDSSKKTPESVRSRTKTPVKTPDSVRSRTKTPVKTPESSKKTPESVRSRTKTPVKTPESSKKTPESAKSQTKTPVSRTSSCVRTPMSKKEEYDSNCTPTSADIDDHQSEVDDQQSDVDDHHSEVNDNIPRDENNEEYLLNPTHPSAQDYIWMMYSDNEVIVFGNEYDGCYGIYRTDKTIDPSQDFKVSSAWKKLLRMPSSQQKTFLSERGIELKSID